MEKALVSPRRLTPAGHAMVSEILKPHFGKDTGIPMSDAERERLRSVLFDDEYTELVEGTQLFDIDTKTDLSKLELAKRIKHAFGDMRRVVEDEGIMEWISLVLLDTLQPKDADGLRRLHEEGRILLGNAKAKYRNLVRFACQFYMMAMAEGGERKSGMLPYLNRRARDFKEVEEQIMMRSELFGLKSVREAVSFIFTDETGGHFIRGHSRYGHGEVKAGVRQFANTLMQYAVTYDLEEMHYTEIVNRFLPKTPDFADWWENVELKRRPRPQAA